MPRASLAHVALTQALVVVATTFALIVLIPPSPTIGVGARPAQAAEHRRVDPRTGLLEVPVDELVVAVRHKDRAEIGRVAERLGPARLAQALRRPDASTVNAAMVGLLAIPGRARLLSALTDLVAGGDPGFTATALHAMGEILAPLTVSDLDDWEIPPDVVHAACAAMRTTLAVPANSTVNRLAAIDAMADASAACATVVPPPELAALLQDPTPAIRRAAALMLRPQQRLATGGFASGIRDIDKSVMGASVAALCELIAVRGGPAAVPASAREPIWEQTRQTARRIINAPDTSADDAVQMLDCLDPTLASDRQMLLRIRERRRTPMGDRAAEVLGQK
jgi:hypothetical protein